MGLFNYVDFEVNCPECGAQIKQFQTKEGILGLDVVKFTTVNNFHAICPNCQAFIEFYYAPDKERTIEDYKLRVIRLKNYENNK